ncbi:hypothetical protein VOLCADRAFT_103616 [Volvox carteri f. nagariensis]|uniref:SET domain-containing protein n=1 Tax=Volvox carteri f. nagariensis TaxID=3068 RepID=D8TND4_VOLCA|nr:uncharacterized protein VOLCADRAFT_103616 [Volvox carteri f. nagariensis]EFJ50972.1 hypothetical protein VOLCADRAFT_103616 [Volvox carteri f. nagariensis]|eukprot:XP_002947984.1 hypothetical protein VOLCADRAFT_103616 [Volvox carteri f. nagariensis]
MLHAYVLVALLICHQASSQPLDKIENLFKWVRDLGGEIHLEVKNNRHGVRGAFATKSFAENDVIAAIPSATIMNTGSFNESFAVPTLTVLRELKDPHSRFKPYVDMWPKPDELVNSCNMDLKYAPMWKSAYWEKNMRDWDLHLRALLAGELDADLEYTIKEMVGNAEVTLDDLKYACAISSTRYVSSLRRRRLLMAPIFDLANHWRNCSSSLSAYETGDFLYFMAGENINAGDEVCYSYGSLRDDYAVAHYGFLPDLEDPPRLALVDTPDYNPNKPYSHDEPPSEEPFDGTPAELRAEMERLQLIYNEIKATPDVLPPTPKGQDYVYDLLKALEERRLNALAYEIRRIAGLLNVKAEL